MNYFITPLKRISPDWADWLPGIVLIDINKILTFCWAGSHLVLVTGISTVLSCVSHLLLTTSSQLVPLTSMHTLVGSAVSSVTVLVTQLSLGTFLHTFSVTLLTWETSTQEHFSTGWSLHLLLFEEDLWWDRNPAEAGDTRNRRNDGRRHFIYVAFALWLGLKELGMGTHSVRLIESTVQLGTKVQRLFIY